MLNAKIAEVSGGQPTRTSQAMTSQAISSGPFRSAADPRLTLTLHTAGSAGEHGDALNRERGMTVEVAGVPAETMCGENAA